MPGRPTPQPGGFQGLVPVQITLREQELPLRSVQIAAHGKSSSIPMWGRSPSSKEHDNGLTVVGYVDDLLCFDDGIVDYLEYLITPLPHSLVAVEGASHREVGRVSDFDSLVAEAERWHPGRIETVPPLPYDLYVLLYIAPAVSPFRTSAMPEEGT